MKHLLTLIVTLLACASCQAPASLPAGDTFGEPIVARAIVPFATVHAAPSDYYEQTLLVEATTTAVCLKAGCWMQIEDAGQTAMVRWETGCGGKYVFPEDLVGRRVVIQGSFYPKELSDEDAEHLQEEAGGELDIEREGYEFNASAVLLIADAQ